MRVISTIFKPLIFVAFSIIAACSGGTKDKASVESETEAPKTLQSFIDSPLREQDSARDPFRHPAKTLDFFEIGPGKHVAEIWPGWYTEILAPYLAANEGRYTAILYPDNMGERSQKRTASFKEKFSDTEIYGAIEYGAFGKDHGSIMAPESADIILTFRNVHNWMGGGYADQAFSEFYAALKPGGILGVVEHRLPETAMQDPRGASGYVQESYIKALAEEAGFKFVASSEINANPRDTADHPLGVWTLPPRSLLPEAGSDEAIGFDPALYRNIGESDRATLKFRKPETE